MSKKNRNNYRNENRVGGQVNKIMNNNVDNSISVEKNDEVELGLYLIKNVFEKEIEESQTKYIRGSVRSGNKIMYDGSIVIIGDVNAGAEIVAGENIAIIGALRGVAHAGANGNKKATISAGSIEAPQLRISNLVWENEESVVEKTGIKHYAYVDGADIKIEE